ncbi:MAG: redoxin domain-containing protein [Rhodoglobus sp.]|nr:redoxin domain-containing protein [Rhodoglobus sp.]
MMRLFRRFFVEGTVVVALVAIGAAVVAALGSSSWWWLGVPLAWLPVLGYFGYLLIARPSTHTRNLWPLYGIALAGVLVALFAGPVAVLIALPGLAAILAYSYVYSRQHVPTGGIRVDEPLPTFPLQRTDGTAATSAELTDRPYVIMFYRGNWCPFCMVQVRELAEQYRELDRRGVGVALISAQRAADTAELATKFDIPMRFYVDADGAAARALDLVQVGGTPAIFSGGTNGDTTVPTVVITDARGTVLWVDSADNHRIRPEPTAFLEVLDRAGITA